MIGFETEWENKYDKVLYKLFEGTDTSQMCWRVYDEEIWLPKWEGNCLVDVFSKAKLNDLEFRTAIAQDNYYVYHGILSGYFSHEDSFLPFHTYGDFLQGNCQIVVIWEDGVYCEVYAKDANFLEILAANAEKHARNFNPILSEKEIMRIYFE